MGRTLDKGLRKFTDFSKSGTISGKDAFILDTSFGFPIDLTQLMAEERNVKVDLAGFEKAMAEFKDASKKRKQDKDEKDMTLKAAQVDILKKTKNLAITDTTPKYDWVTTGDGECCEATIIAIYDGKNFIEKCNSDSQIVGLVFDKTPCYAEQGGQVEDVAEIYSKSGVEFSVMDTQTYAGYVLHSGNVTTNGSFQVGDAVSVKVDYTRRSLIAKNHTATHILNFALRKVLGGKVDQKGSLVDAEKLRFDFSHNSPISIDDLRKVEQICNQEIQKAHAVCWQNVELNIGKRIGGLRAVFGETYPDPVRVVSIGPTIPDILANVENLWGETNSVEFCGGTHVANSKEIYKFVVLVEEGISKGVRRIVAVTGPQAAVEATLKANALRLEVDEARSISIREMLLDKKIADLRHNLDQDKEVSLVMKKDMLTEVNDLKEKRIKIVKEAAKEMEKNARKRGEEIAKECKECKSEKYVGVVDVGDGDDAKAVAVAMNIVSKQCPDKCICLLSNAGGKIAVETRVPANFSAKFSAKAWCDQVLTAIGGKGNGNETRAQRQADDVQRKKLEEAKKAANK